MYGIQFTAMGCHMEALLDTDTPQAALWLNEIVARFAAWEQAFSRFRPGSELSCLNRSGAAAVSDDLWRVLQAALQAAQFSGGLVTPAVGQAVCAAGYTQSFVAGRDVGATETGRAVPDWREIECNTARRQVRLPHGMRLDLGGIAKGWCAQEAAALSGAICFHVGGRRRRYCP